MRHSRWCDPYEIESSGPRRMETEKGENMANDVAGKPPAGQKPMVRIEYCTS
jgi:hypothetical protein